MSKIRGAFRRLLAPGSGGIYSYLVMVPKPLCREEDWVGMGWNVN